MPNPEKKPDPGHDRTRAQVLSAFDHAKLSPSALVLFARLWVETIVNIGTALNYARACVFWLAWCEKNGVDPLQATIWNARKYLTDMTPLYANKTLGVYCSVGRMLYRFAIKDGLVTTSPFEGVKPGNTKPKEATPALTESQFDHLLATAEDRARAAKRSLGAWRDFTAIYVLGRIGLRRFELVQLCRSSLRQDGDVWRLRVDGKGDISIVMRIPLDVAEALLAWIEWLEGALGRPLHPSEPLFPAIGQRAIPPLDADGRLIHLSTGTLTDSVSKRMKDAGLEGPRMAPHCLRSTAATIGYKYTGNVSIVQRMLRHADQATTLIYIKRYEDNLGSAADSWRPKQRPPGGTDEEPKSAPEGGADAA